MPISIEPTIRRMNRQDLNLAIDWAAGEGWNPGLMDAGPFMGADPQGFFLAELEGKAVGSLSAVAYDSRFGFVGLYIVRPEYRGQGHGRRLFRAGLDYLGSRTIGLDGVPAQQETYRRYGFDAAYRTFRYEGTARLGSPLAAAESSGALVDLRSIPLDDLAAYDVHVFPSPRPTFLEAWIRQPGTAALGALRSGRLAGYGVLRPCRVGYKIGPLAADDEGVAEILFEGLLAQVPGEKVYLDTPEPNRAATGLAERHGMTPVFNTARMYRGTPPTVDLERTFGVTTLELG